MADIKLSYFDARGRAELSRLILAYAGVRYTDQRLTGEQFASVKAKLPWGQLPTIKYNGTMLTQSMAIARFLATEYGLTGRTSLEGAQADEIVDACTDIVNARAGAVFEPDEGKKAEKMQAYLSQTLPTGMDRMEKLLVERGGQFMVGNRLTWADLAIFCLIDPEKKNNTELMVTRPCLDNLLGRVAEVPNIANWLNSRPDTIM